MYLQIEQTVQLVMITANGGECPDVVACATNPCDCAIDANCADCPAHGCNVCVDCYYKKILIINVQVVLIILVVM